MQAIFHQVEGGMSVSLEVDPSVDLMAQIGVITGVELVCPLPFGRGLWVAFTDECFGDGQRIEKEINQLLTQSQ
jgi:hypothetical protein